jgi:hypothetical protein
MLGTKSLRQSYINNGVNSGLAAYGALLTRPPLAIALTASVCTAACFLVVLDNAVQIQERYCRSCFLCQGAISVVVLGEGDEQVARFRL